MKCKKCNTELKNFYTIMTMTADGQMQPLRAYYCRCCKRSATVPHGAYVTEV